MQIRAFRIHNTDWFGRIFHNEGRQLMTHVNVAHMSTGDAALKDAVFLHHLATLTMIKT